jgi:menaquinone-dependent protoporphyrinogen oxidase
MDRRNFLLYSGLMLSASAYIFGQNIKPGPDEKSIRTALIYGTRYGATEDTAQWIAKGMGDKVDVINIETMNFDESAGKYDRFVIGSGIWIDGVHQRLMEFLSSHKDEIQSKIIASFIVCGTTGEDEAGRKRIESYFERFHKPLDIKPPLQKHLGGRMVIAKLSEKDRKLLENFYHKIVKKEFADWDRTEPKEAELLGASIKVKISGQQRSITTLTS